MIGRVAALSLALLASAHAATPANPPARGNCLAAAHRSLDFWVGEWTVFDKANGGAQVGTSRIEAAMNGCGISERYEAPNAPGGAYAGVSYSAFDRNDGKWHQFYVDVNGNATWYTGAMRGKDMVMTAAGANGMTQRMTYRPLADGSVEQIGESTADGKTWQPGYDYVYRKK